MVKKETLQRLVIEYKGENLVEYLGGILDDYANQQCTLSRYQREENKLTFEYKQALGNINAKRKEVQNDCPHYETENKKAVPFVVGAERF